MWDPEALASDELYNYTPFVQKLADLTVDFGRPVLLLNGDSHFYGSDKPLAHLCHLHPAGPVESGS
jgi:hypothetical protein